MGKIKFSWLAMPQVLIPILGIAVMAVVASRISMPQFLDSTGIFESTERMTSTTESVPIAKTLTPDGKGTITKITITDKYEGGKTGWDWASLFLAPASLALFAAWLQWRQEQARQERIEIEKQKEDIAEALATKQAQLEKEQIKENEREEVLREYIDRISDILLDKQLFTLNKNSFPDSAVLDSALNIIRARTLSILGRLNEDKERKARVLSFLHEAELIKNVGRHVVLHYADFSHADLSGVFLVQTILAGANLSHADLRRTVLLGANLRSAKLHYADLTGANLAGTELAGAEFLGADLSGVTMLGDNTQKREQLSNAKLCKTTLPEGLDLDPNRDCKELESQE